MNASAALGRVGPRDHNLPVMVASFVGRDGELADIRSALAQSRLVTLTGPGGCGKTHLGVRVAEGLASRFADGIWLVQLAPLMDASQVPRAVASTLGIGGRSDQPLEEALLTSLISRQLLLVLDNCEHLIAACAQITETLLRRCPHLRVLTTSHEPLRVPGEVVHRVPPLALPLPGPLPPLEALAKVEAIELFVERARSRQPGFRLSRLTAPAVAEICSRLEGLPLAIELAAAQLGALSLGDVARQLDDTLGLLEGGSRTTPRQATLRATLDWSHALLSDAERALFRRLSVFAGSFGRAAAEQVCGDEALAPGTLFRLLAGVIDKSLVEAQVMDRQARYRLLEPVRQYAWDHLVRHGEAATLQQRHAAYYVELAEGAEPELMGGQRTAAMERLGAEHDNLRAALTWSQRSTEKSAIELGLRLAAALFWFWNFRGEVSEGLEWLETLLAKGDGVAAVVRAKVLHGAGELSWLMGRNERARSRLEESAALYRTLGDQRGLAYDLQAMAMVVEQPAALEAATESLRLFEEIGDAWGAGHAFSALQLCQARGPQAEQLMEEALATWRALGDAWGIAQHLNMLGDIARSHGDHARATDRYEEALHLLREVGMSGTVPSLLHNLAYLVLHEGDTRRALGQFRESLVLFRDQGDQRGIAECLEGIAAVLAAVRQAERAAFLLGAAEALRDRLGTRVWPANAADVAQTLAAVRPQLDEARLRSAWSEGRTLPLERALAEALTAEHLDAASAPRAGDVLTSREREVALLVAQGLTNRQIGERLVTAEGTARLHVKHILRKLGFSSRAQIAAWVVQQGIADPNDADIPLRP